MVEVHTGIVAHLGIAGVYSKIMPLPTLFFVVWAKS